ncbi:MAG: FHA domain-containing protein [Saprospiraceae bacterium]|nr:FHA domain-containing protein [Saprospiraceae bacterium]
MSGKTHSASEAEPKTEFTIHINPNDKSLQIAKLHVIANENNRAQSFFLEEGEYLIGRQSDDDLSVVNKIRIVTEDTKMSRSHCQISVVMKADKTYRYILTDLGSLNGTHLETTSGTKKLDKNEKVIIQLGDIVGLGYRTQIKIEI